MGTDNVCKELVLKTIISPPQDIIRTILSSTVRASNLCTCDKCLADVATLMICWHINDNTADWQTFKVNPRIAGYLMDKYSKNLSNWRA